MVQSKLPPAGAKVRVVEPGPVPQWSEWDEDGQRTSGPVKKRLQRMFFLGDKRIQAEVLYLGNESERDKLRNLGRCKVQIRDSAGSMIVITADATNLHHK
jgi:hypothetical protein